MPINHDFTALPEETDASLKQVVNILHGIRAALADLLHSAGCDPSQTRETARRLKLSRGLVWRLSNIVASNEMSVVAQGLPSRKSAEALFTACRDRGASNERVEALRTALQKFEQEVKHLSGDRRSLEMILSNAEHENITNQQEQARKLAVQANGTIWGVQAKLQLRSCFIAPGEGSRRSAFAFASVAGLIELRRVRSVPWPVYVESIRGDKGENLEGSDRPIDSRSHRGPPMMLDYCSTPVPEIHSVSMDTGTVYEVVGGALGNPGATTIVCGSLGRQAISKVSPEYEKGLGSINFLTDLHTPVDHLLVDVFLHRDLASASPPKPTLIGRMLHPHSAVITSEDLEQRKMPLTIGLRELSPGAEGAMTQHIPWYPGMMRHVCEQGGWDPNDFRGYRLEMKYPPNPTVLVIGTRMLGPDE